MTSIDNILTSGHEFSDDNNLMKFRFVFLNVLMLTVTFFTVVNYFVSVFGAIDFGRTFENALLLFLITSIFAFCILRSNRSYYIYVVNFFILSSLLLFYFVLLSRTEDEFRLVAFFMAIFVAYVLLGKMYGACMTVFIVVSIVFLKSHYDLALSKYAFSTFFSFFSIFAIFLYFFLKMIESDAVEFQVLKGRLEATAQKEIQQRKDQEVMLLHQSRMANMGEMLDSIAHQWRQPLMHINSILMNMDVALEKKQKDEPYLSLRIDDVATLTQHMSQTIEDFRDLFKLEKERHRFAIESVIDDVLALLKNRFNNITVEYRPVGNDLIYGYKNELIQVIIILLNNAVDAFDKNNVGNKLINIRSDVSHKRSLIEIEDNAGGIVSENAADIFEPYFTTKDQIGGTGLGLYIAKIIVEQKMNGSITASNTNNGAVFSLAFVTYADD